ncbi:MAG TPA: hypothetical protein VMU69_03430 [Bradyrhizobium sp.]|nr:hypothetical protein [Bradyrhizobium sp.]
MPDFYRAIPDSFIEKLILEKAKGGWWADVLADDTLFVALRGTYVDVYSRGQRLFQVREATAGLNVETHEKYLINPDLRHTVRLGDGEFQIADLQRYGFIPRYEGKSTLNAVKRASAYYANSEREGCHTIAVNNQSVIDCEIAFSGWYQADDGNDERHGKVDLAYLESDGDNVRLEAKHYDNNELRSDLRYDRPAPVCAQVARYRNYLSTHRDIVLNSYVGVCKNLVALEKMGATRKPSPLISSVAMGRPLILDEIPKVGLIIFGFDEAQRDHARWQRHLKRLEHCISPSPIIIVGNPKDIQL